MRKPYALLSRFWKDESGAAAAEYALLLALIAAAMAIAAVQLGTAVRDVFYGATNCIETPDATNCS